MRMVLVLLLLIAVGLAVGWCVNAYIGNRKTADAPLCPPHQHAVLVGEGFDKDGGIVAAIMCEKNK